LQAAELRARAAAEHWDPQTLAREIQQQTDATTPLQAWRLAAGLSVAELVERAVGLDLEAGALKPGELSCVRLQAWEQGDGQPDHVASRLLLAALRAHWASQSDG
jgi:hypothetical protein